MLAFGLFGQPSQTASERVPIEVQLCSSIAVVNHTGRYIENCRCNTEQHLAWEAAIAPTWDPPIRREAKS